MKKMISLLLMASLLISCDTNNPVPDETAKPFNLTAVQKQRVVQDNEFAFDLLFVGISRLQELGRTLTCHSKLVRQHQILLPFFC